MCSFWISTFSSFTILIIYTFYYLSTLILSTFYHNISAYARNMKVHVHLEEQQKEIDDCLEVHGMRPLELLLKTVPAEQLANFCAVHCTHSEQKQLQQYFDAGGGVCICPLTEASLGDGVFLSPEACNGVVSLGTDCNARIDMVRWRWCVVQCFGTCLMWWAQFFLFFIFYFSLKKCDGWNIHNAWRDFEGACTPRWTWTTVTVGMWLLC